MTTLAPVSLADRVQQLISSGEFYLPPVPALAARLQTALEDEATDSRKVAELIRAEPAIAASLLRTANSAAFGGLNPISDLSQAIARLGLKQVQTLVTALLVQGQFEANKESNQKLLETLWNHAIASATVARDLASREGYPAEEAFMAGLLHGIGRLIVLRALDRLMQLDSDLTPTETAIDELVEAFQFQLGYSTLRSWNLSDDICEAARAMDPEADPPEKTILRIVQAADHIAKKLGMHPHADPDLNLMDQDAIEALEISDVEMAALMIDLEDEIDEIRSAFDGA